MSLIVLFSALLAVSVFHPHQPLKIVAVVNAKKINRNAPHGHMGLLSQYKPGPFDTVLDKRDEKDLQKGNPVMKQLPGDDGDDLSGKAICVQDVAAPKNAVWNQILDLDSYKGKVNKLKECKNYLVKRNDDGTIRIKTKMVIGVMPGYSVRKKYVFIIDPRQCTLFSILLSLIYFCFDTGCSILV